MGYIRQRNTKSGVIRFQAEIRLKGHKTLTATFDRKTDAKRWIQKVESEIRCGRHQLYSEKNTDMRSIPLCGLALELLKKFSSNSLSLGFVFPSKDRKKPLDLRRAFRTAIKKAQLKEFRGHDCRHSYATEMLAQGLSLGEIGILLGHRSVQVTKKYCHLIESRSIDAVAKMSDEIFKEVEHG